MNGTREANARAGRLPLLVSETFAQERKGASVIGAFVLDFWNSVFLLFLFATWGGIKVAMTLASNDDVQQGVVALLHKWAKRKDERPQDSPGMQTQSDRAEARTSRPNRSRLNGDESHV
jgi:hypothetical protein